MWFFVLLKLIFDVIEIIAKLTIYSEHCNQHIEDIFNNCCIRIKNMVNRCMGFTETKTQNSYIVIIIHTPMLTVNNV